MLEKEARLKRIGAVPIWWHNHGSKMKVKVLGIQRDLLVLQGSAAEVIIIRAVDGWSVIWKINYASDAGVRGKTWFSPNDLAEAFGLRNTIFSKSGKWLIERFGGTTAKQGAFIRYKDWLNIPGPGTGHDGDPNVSILLNSEIKKAVEKLLESNFEST